MLQKLHIQNYAIIDDIEIKFSNELNIITGETGAGKSILMGALNLILGERADTSFLKNNSKKCFIEGFFKVEEKLEFTYRLARIYDDTNKPQEAIEHYKEAIQLGADRKEYYAARSALQIGEILEKQNKKTQAIVYFEQCLSMKGHEYKNSLDQRAKAGIARCKGE